MSSKKVLTVYKSVTGFTKEYAEMIARETGCALMDLKKATAEILSDFDTVIFGGRLHAGTIDGLKRARELFQQSKASQFIVYTTGATPNTVHDIIDEMWRNNLSPEELLKIPHFYMQSGLRYERMPLTDKLMMKMFYTMIKKKKDKSEYEKQMEKAITGSCDFSSKEYIIPLLAILKSEDEEKEQKIHAAGR